MPECTVSDWKFAGVSVCGTSHVAAGIPCQDANAGTVTRDGALIVAVADGAGSASHGGTGSETAVKAAVGILEHALSRGTPPVDEATWKTLFSETFPAVRAALDAKAASLGITLRDLATTLLVFVADARGVAAAQVGDGAMVVVDGAGEMHLLTTPDNGEFINETTFLTSDDALAALQAGWREGAPRHIAALTDGLQAIALLQSPLRPHAPFFKPFFRCLDENTVENAREMMQNFFQSPRVTQRADDDITLVVAGMGNGASPA